LFLLNFNLHDPSLAGSTGVSTRILVKQDSTRPRVDGSVNRVRLHRFTNFLINVKPCTLTLLNQKRDSCQFSN
jgi:hypothetical protein